MAQAASHFPGPGPGCGLGRGALARRSVLGPILATGPRTNEKKNRAAGLAGPRLRCSRAARASSRVGCEFAQAEMAVLHNKRTIFLFLFPEAVLCIFN